MLPKEAQASYSEENPGKLIYQIIDHSFLRIALTWKLLAEKTLSIPI